MMHKIQARRVVCAALASLALAGSAACDIDEQLTVPDPDVATPESVLQPSALPAVRAGAIGDVALALSGSGGVEDGLIQYTALFTDEFAWAETFPTREQIDRRSIDPINATLQTLFLNLQRARASAERAADAYGAVAPNDPARAEMLNLAAFTYNNIAETYCSGVPFSTLTTAGATEYGAPLPTDSIYLRAIARADAALQALGTATTAAANTQRHFANVQRARALQNLGRFTEARTAAAAVPTDFAYQLQFSENSGRQNNGVHVVVLINRRFTTADNEGGNGLPFRTSADPRTNSPRGTGAASTGFDGATPLFVQQKYANRSAPITIADGVEARLIEAEADLRAGNAATALATLNALRTRVTGLTPLADAGTADARVAQLYQERAFWLFLTSHRLGDLRRLVRVYQRPAESVFPTGTFFKGGTYGTDVNFPVPFVETNNTNFQQCIDRNA